MTHALPLRSMVTRLAHATRHTPRHKQLSAQPEQPTITTFFHRQILLQ